MGGFKLKCLKKMRGKLRGKKLVVCPLHHVMEGGLVRV
jgi:hypothetical protein